jgi:hypothetical protein
MTFVKRIHSNAVPCARDTNSCVDEKDGRAYIGGGPRLPNEALSFWKE